MSFIPMTIIWHQFVHTNKKQSFSRLNLKTVKYLQQIQEDGDGYKYKLLTLRKRQGFKQTTFKIKGMHRGITCI